jgi:oligopeptidase B
MEPQAPVARQQPHPLTVHGHTRTDPFYWLNQREDPEVLAYLHAENTYLEKVMAPYGPLREELFQEITARIKQDDQSVPFLDNGYFYFNRYTAGKEYPLYYRKAAHGDAQESLFLDLNALAAGHAYFDVSHWRISQDNRYLAFGEDTLSRRVYTLRFKDLHTDTFLADEIPNTNGEAVWAADCRHVFYTQKDPRTLRGYRIMRHAIGTPAGSDVEVFREDDESFDAHIYLSKSRKYLIILSSQTITKEYQILEADNPLGDFRVFQPRERGLEYEIAHSNGFFYIRTNLQARNFRLMKTPEQLTEKSNWAEVLPHREDVLLEEIDAFADFLAISERRQGLTQIFIYPLDGQEGHYLPFSEEVYMVSTSVNREMDTQKLRINYQSLTTPQTIYDYDRGARTFELLKQEEILGGFSPENYQSERLFARARDGAAVPVSIVYRKGFKKDGSQPLLLYGYGSYGISIDPSFGAARLSLLDRGFAFAIAHIRGGEELGRAWYEDGKLLKKKNTFFDFIDCAEYLLRQGYTSREGLFAMGGSAGGLLMGAIANLRPDLWKGIVAAVPFVDVVTTMLDESIPLTTFEYDEWGNPADKTYYEYMLSYSPYDNVNSGAYPAMLVVTGLHDSQVQYWEPAKWVAKLRLFKTDEQPLLLYTNMASGHSGASGRFERYRETALEYAFLIKTAFPDSATATHGPRE